MSRRALPTLISSPHCSFAFSMTNPTLAHQLAAFACSLNFEDLSENVVHEVKRRLIDSLGCALGAWNEEPCTIARNVVSDFSTKNGATVFGTSQKAPPDWAAFANGCCIRYFDYNDTYLSKEPAHPSDNFSAVLAVGESVGATGKEMILATAIAYEVQCRLCDAASIRARGWDHPTYGAFSTALACAKLMKLDPERTRHAINIAGVHCAAFRQARVGELSHWKGVAFANASRLGVYAALLARAGMTGPAPIFEGAMGFEKEVGVALGNVAEIFDKSQEAIPGEGPASMILKTSIKYWPAEYHSQSAIEAALFLRNQIADLSQVKTMVIDGEVTDKQFSPERFTETGIVSFLQGVKVQRNDELSALYAEAVANIVHVNLADGRTLTKRVDYPLGNAKNRLKDPELEGKFLNLAAPKIGKEAADAVLKHCWKFDEAASVGDLMKSLEISQ